MHAVRNVLLVLLILSGNSTCGLAQEQDTAVATITIPKGIFKGSLLDPSLFHDVASSLIEEHKRELQDAIQETIYQQSQRKADSSYLVSSLRTGEFVCLDWRSDKCVVRVLSESDWKSWQATPNSALPRDAKAKDFFQVKSVQADGVMLEKGATQIAIPLQSIIYLQRGTEPLAN